MVVELVKSIKPRKLKPKQVRLNILNGLRKEGKEIEKLMDKTTATWQGEKPKFESLIGLTGKDASVVVGPTGSDRAVLKWVWIDGGTRPHRIEARNKPNLVFRTTFRPKTKTGVISSFKGVKAPPWRSTPVVNHPGTKPRKFSETIIKRRRKRFRKNIIIAVRPVYGT